MAATKMTREQMIEKLMSLHKGSKVRCDDKIYTVLGISEPMGKLCRRDTAWLEDGKPDVYYVPGKYLAAGKMIECTNRIYRTLKAQRDSMDFEMVEA